jgi:hypothetical protein
MQEKVFIFQNSSYKIRPFNAVDGVIIFHVLKPSSDGITLDLAVMFGWVDRRLVDLTAYNSENNQLLETSRRFILSTYRLN